MSTSMETFQYDLALALMNWPPPQQQLLQSSTPCVESIVESPEFRRLLENTYRSSMLAGVHPLQSHSSTVLVLVVPNHQQPQRQQQPQQRRPGPGSQTLGVQSQAAPVGALFRGPPPAPLASLTAATRKPSSPPHVSSFPLEPSAPGPRPSTTPRPVVLGGRQNPGAANHRPSSTTPSTSTAPPVLQTFGQRTEQAFKLFERTSGNTTQQPLSVKDNSPQLIFNPSVELVDKVSVRDKVIAVPDKQLPVMPRQKRQQFRREWCGLCKKNGEMPKVYRGHKLHTRLEDGTEKVSCPVLRKLVCDQCGATGDTAHTRSRCPVGFQTQPLAVLLKKTPRRCDGTLRPMLL